MAGTQTPCGFEPGLPPDKKSLVILKNLIDNFKIIYYNCYIRKRGIHKWVKLELKEEKN